MCAVKTAHVFFLPAIFLLHFPQKSDTLKTAANGGIRKFENAVCREAYMTVVI